jgi:hypothetical protein
MNLKKQFEFAHFAGIILMYFMACRYLSTTLEVDGLLFKAIGFLLVTITLIMSVPYDINIEDEKDERN